MRKIVMIVVVPAMVLGACSTVRESRVNPFNWFGRGQETSTVSVNTNALIPVKSGLMTRPAPATYSGLPISKVTKLKVERIPGGAIINVTGISRIQGAHTAELKAENDGLPVKGVITYRFLVLPPAQTTGVGPEQSREVHVAAHLTDQEMIGVRSIKVVAATNAMTSRR